MSWKVAIFPLAEISIVGCFIKGCCSQEIFVFPSGVEIPVFFKTEMKSLNGSVFSAIMAI